MSEEVVVDSAQVDEFTEFMLGRWPSLVRFGYALTGDLGLAEDLAQTALTRACVAWPRVRRAADPDAYVHRIMINSNRSRFRRRRVAEQLTGSLSEIAALATCADSTSDYDASAELMAALMRLPAGQRAVVVLRYWMDLSEVETAACIGCSVGNVKSQAARALAKLRLGTELVNGASHGR